MARVATPALIRQIETLFDSGSAVGLGDRHLIERFHTGQGTEAEVAFATLVSRHGPMVLKVCLQLLRDRQHAEDAFQAVFLVLARKARSIQNPDQLANWLYGVSLRTARCLKSRTRNRPMERQGMEVMNGPCIEPSSPFPSPEQIAIDREQAELLHVEIERLPKNDRLPILLCHFQGLTLDQAATHLAWPQGTLRTRLAHARDKLKARLARRGVTLSSAALITVLSQRSSAAQLSAQLFHSTAKAAIQFAAGQAVTAAVSASSALISQEVLRGMAWKTISVTVLSVVTLLAVGSGVGYLDQSLAMMKEDPMTDPALSKSTPSAKPASRIDHAQPLASTPKQPARGRMIVTGSVVDPSGKPVAGALIDLVGRRRYTYLGASLGNDVFQTLGQGKTDKNGHIHIEAPRTSSTDHDSLIAVAAKLEYGPGWSLLNPDADQPSAEIRLRPEGVVQVRLVDLRGLPAAGVEVIVQSMGTASAAGTYDGVGFWETPPKGLNAWPQPGLTDSDGRLRIRGLGRGFELTLKIADPRYAQQDVVIKPADSAAAKDKPITVALQSAKMIEGRVLASDTGLPIPRAIISAQTRVHNERANGFFTTKFQADDQGRFKINPISGESYTLGAFPVDGEPYLVPQETFSWTKGAIRAERDIKLPRGVLIRGKVTQAGTGRALAASNIQYIPARSQDGILSGWQAIVASRDDGTFQIVVPAGKGHLLIFGPTSEYILEEIGSNRLYSDQQGGMRYYAHKIVAYDAKTTDGHPDLNVELKPGLTIKGRVNGPQGQKVTQAFLVTTLGIRAINPFWRGGNLLLVRDGRFQLDGLAPDAVADVSVLDPDHQWGTTLKLSGKQVNEDVVIQLEPCGQAKARFVGPDGKPVVNYWPHFEFVARAGVNRYSRKREDRAKLSADADYVANVDNQHHAIGLNTDADGRITLPALIPGAQYQIIDFSTVNDENGPSIRKEFRVKPGETLDFGNILIEKPNTNR